MSEHSRGERGLRALCKTLALGMILIFGDEMCWGPFGGSGVPVCTVSSKKKRERKGKRCIQLSGGSSGTHGAMNRWVGDGVLRVNTGNIARGTD